MDSNNLERDLVARNQRQNSVAPPARDGMMIRSTNTAILDSNVDIIVVISGLGVETDHVEISVAFVITNSITLSFTQNTNNFRTI
jgi:hypothetical protein